MLVDEKYIKSYDGELIYAKEYTTDDAKCTIIVTTDVKEYSSLYDDFANIMQEKKCNVFLYDLRAHKNSAKELFGTYSNDFFNDSLRDLLFLNKYLSKKYNLPVVNVGIGYGGTIISRMLQFYNDSPTLNVLIGTHFEPTNISNYFFRILTRLTMVFLNKNSEAKLINKWLNYNLKHKFEDGSYLSTKKKYIDKIKDDKFCNFNLSANILNSMFRGEIHTFNKKNMSKINPMHKFLICSGEFDIITNFAKQTAKLSHKFHKCKLHCEKIIFKDLRHNLINESNTAFVEYLEKFIGENL